MATYDDFIATAAREGLSRSEIANAVQTYVDTYGKFDTQPIQPDPALAARVASKNLLGMLTDKHKEATLNVLSEEDIAFQQNMQYYNALDGATYSDFEAKYRMEENYPTLSAGEILNENRKVLGYEPWLTFKEDRGIKAVEAIRLGAGHTIGSLVRSIAGKVEFGLATAAQSVRMPYAYTGVGSPAGGLTTYYPEPRSQPQIEKNVEQMDQLATSMFKDVMDKADEIQSAVEGDIPNYIRAGVPAKLAGAFGEVPLIFLSAYDPSFILSRYYAEGLQESNGDRRIASGYAALFGTIGYLVDRYTVGLGGDAFKAMKVGTRGKLVTKQLGKIGVRSQIAGFNELVTEFAESASLQAVTKDEINWKQAIEEGLLAYVVGSFTAGAADSISTIKQKQNEIIDKLKEVGFTEQSAVAYYNAIDNLDFSGANALGYTEVLRILGGDTGFDAVSDPLMDTPIPRQYMPYTLGRLRDIRNNKTDTEIEQFVQNRPEAYRGELREALLMPTEKSTANLNQAIARFMLSDIKIDVNKTVDGETLPEISGNVEPTVQETVGGLQPVAPLTLEEVLKTKDLDHIIEIIALDAANGMEIAPNLFKALNEKVPQNYMSDVISIISRRATKYRIDIAEANILTPSYYLGIGDRSQKVQGLLDQSSNQFDLAVQDWVSQYEEALLMKGTNKETARKEAIEFNAELVREIGGLFNKGAVNDIMAELDKRGYINNFGFYHNIINATRMRLAAWEQHRADQPQPITEEDMMKGILQEKAEFDLTEEGEPELV